MVKNIWWFQKYLFALCSMEQINDKGKPGRKPGKDNKIPLTIYIEESVIAAIGGGWLITGKDTARNIATNAIYDYRQKKELK